MNRDAAWVKAEREGIELAVDPGLLAWSVNHVKERWGSSHLGVSDATLEKLLRAVIYQSQRELVADFVWCQKHGALIAFGVDKVTVRVYVRVFGEVTAVEAENPDLFTAIAQVRQRVSQMAGAEAGIPDDRRHDGG